MSSEKGSHVCRDTRDGVQTSAEEENHLRIDVETKIKERRSAITWKDAGKRTRSSSINGFL